MKCPKCGREFSNKKQICIYCGAALDGQASPKTNYPVNEVSNIFISDDQDKEVALEDLPAQVRRQVEGAVSKKNDGVVVEDESTIVQSPFATANGQTSTLSIEKVLSLLSKMRASVNHGRLEQSVYERMAAGIIKDYISTLDDDTKLDFVVNRISDSELSDYLNEKILNDLRSFVISSISDINKL